MSTIHFVLQGKGGVGKSVIAALIAQYLARDGQSPLCIDTDPVNSTFEGYKALNVQRLDILQADEINTRKFDDLIEMIVNTETDVIVDNGASSFVPLSHYIISNGVEALLREMGRKIVIHTVIAGSQSLLDTINGFSQLIEQFPQDSQFAVWLNPYWGAIESQGKSFTEMKAYQMHKARVTDLIELPKLKEETYGHDFAQMLENRETFAESLRNTDLGLMTRQRLKIVNQQIFDAMDKAEVFQ